MTWASNHDGNLAKLLRVQGSLTVGLIMVERAEFLTCQPDETAQNIKNKNPLNYSYLPVEKGNQIIGLYNAERWFAAEAPDTPVDGDFVPLSEEIIIGADSSIFDFLMQADLNPTNLVVSGSRVSGLVSLHDIQQLPVRAALFALITSLEMAMTYAIKTRWPDDAGWMSQLNDERFMKLAETIERSKAADTYVDHITFTQFSDKADLIRRGQILGRSGSSLKRDFKTIRELRDHLAHANSYAQDEAQAKKVCETVRTIYQLKNDLIQYLSS